jgi:SAM-dependent methyltransferase
MARVTGPERYAEGSGPGSITPDGCAVDFYASLPPGHAEADLVASVTTPGATVLELGAGAGRVTHCLVERGLSVVAVDESAEMLRHISGAETIVSPIESLHLSRTFDVVVLASHLVNVPDVALAAALLDACRRHVSHDGGVLVERRLPEWFDSVREVQVERDGVEFALSDIVRHGADELTATVGYTRDGRSWQQTFRTRRVTEVKLDSMLASAGLVLERFLDEPRTWALARPTPAA